MFINSFINDPSRGLWSVPVGVDRSEKRRVTEKKNRHAPV
jgi:hypothetical protein